MGATNRINHYEAMFLVSQAAAHDLGAVVDHIREILARGAADIVAFKKWDERRLAYEIKKHKRGVYFLVYFACDPLKLAAIERACNISETILRSMIIRADHMTEDEMRAADGQEQLADEIRMRAERAAEQQAEANEPEPAAAE